MQINFKGVVITHKVNPRRKHSLIEVDRFGNVTLKTPKVNGSFIEKLLIEKFEWIVQAKKRCIQKEPVIGKEILYLGELQKIADIPKMCTALNKLRCKNQKNIQKAYDSFYKSEAMEYIPKRVAYYAKEMGLKYKEIRFRKMKRRWGSCSKDAVLTFNTHLMQMPHRFIDEVVVHELAHLVYFDHSKAFYELMERYLQNEENGMFSH